MAKPARLQLVSTCLGNLFEHYDTALFGWLSPFLATLIFPEQDPVTALVLTYAIIPLSMLARPLGSVVFGYIGDRYGRGEALFLSLAGMSLVSGGMAFTPTYAQAGLWAPLLFCVGRALQNFLGAGETMGGAIFILEQAPENRHDLLSSIYACSTMGGHLLASLGVVLLVHYQAIETGWRFLYLGGCVTALFGCAIRRAPQWTATSAPLTAKRTSLKATLWTHRKALTWIAIISGFAYANYSIALTLMNGWVPLVSALTSLEVMQINTYLLLLDFCALPIFGWLASKVSREKLMLAAALSVALFATPLLLSLQGASFSAVMGVRALFVLCGVAFFAPFHAWAQQLVPSENRYAVISLGYALGSQLIGGPTAAFSLWCFQKTGMASSVGWYWIALAMLSSTLMALSLQLPRRLLGRRMGHTQPI